MMLHRLQRMTNVTVTGDLLVEQDSTFNLGYTARGNTFTSGFSRLGPTTTAGPFTAEGAIRGNLGATVTGGNLVLQGELQEYRHRVFSTAGDLVLTQADSGSVIMMTASGPATVNLPATPANGTHFTLTLFSPTGSLTIDPVGANIRYADSGGLSVSATSIATSVNFSGVTLIYSAVSDYWIVPEQLGVSWASG